MKAKNFHSNRLGSMRNIKLRNLIMIVLSIIIGFGSIAVFALVNVGTVLENSVQSVRRIIISSDGSDNEATRLFDINIGTKIKLYTSNLSWNEATDLTGVNKILGIDNNGEMIFISKDITLSGSNIIGVTGEIGPIGAAGAAGPQGIKGNTGADGSGFVDNLGNHIAEKNVMIGSNRITYNSDTAQTGVKILPAGNIKLSSTIQVSNLTSSPSCNSSKSGTIRYTNSCFQGCDGISRINLGGTCSAICGDGNQEGGEQCDDNNISNGDGCNSSCERETRSSTCTGLPTNAKANNSISITQTCSFSDGDTCNLWNPSNTTYSYNETSSNNQCYYICNTNYTWVGNACIPNVACGNGTVEGGEACDDNNTSNGDGCSSSCQRETTTYTCPDKPITGTIWNTVNSYTQTYNGTFWAPADTTTTYNTIGSITECRYTCDTNYSRDGIACIPNTQIDNCSAISPNATYNTTGIITQTWDGFGWTPSNISIYDTDPSDTECRYICNDGYIYDGVGDCISTTCGGELPAYATPSLIIPTETGLNREYNTTPGACTFECNSNYTYDTGSHTCIADTRIVDCPLWALGRPIENFQRNTATLNNGGQYTQTRDGDIGDWVPPPVSSYYYGDENDPYCKYKCIDGYQYTNYRPLDGGIYSRDGERYPRYTRGCRENKFISTRNTNYTSTGSSNSNEIQLPLVADGNYDFTINRGDGQIDTITSRNDPKTTHSYATPGSYTLQITGLIKGFRFNNAGDKLKLTQISQRGPLQFKNDGGYFWGAENLVIDVGDSLYLGDTTNLENMFRDCKSITKVQFKPQGNPQITNSSHMFDGAISYNEKIAHYWRPFIHQQNTDMSYMFANANSFNSSLSGLFRSPSSYTRNFEGMFYNASSFSGKGLETWNISGATNLRYMFAGASAFNQDISAKTIYPGNPYMQYTARDTSNITGMEAMFYNASTFNADIGNRNTSKVTDMSHMFNGSAFNKNIDSRNTSQVTNMKAMFANTHFNQGQLYYRDTSKVTDMSYMFYGTYFPGNSLYTRNTSKVTDMSYMFTNSSFNGNILYRKRNGRWDTSNVTNMEGMFQGAYNFNQPLSGLNISKVTSMNNMFNGASNFNQPIGNRDTSKITHMSYMFKNAYSFNQPIGNRITSGVIDMREMFHFAGRFNQDISNRDTSQVTSMQSMFRYANKFDQPLSGRNTSNVTDMIAMFDNAKNFNQDISNRDTSQVTSMRSMFNGASNFNQPIGNRITSGVTSMRSMFNNAYSFNQPLSGRNTSKVTDMRQMFAGATGFNQNISNRNTSKVQYMQDMFSGATSFDQAIGNRDISRIRYDDGGYYGGGLKGMFTNAGLSTANYDDTLNKRKDTNFYWGAYFPDRYITFDAGNSKYSAAGSGARQYLIDNKNRIISDGGPE